MSSNYCVTNSFVIFQLFSISSREVGIYTKYCLIFMPHHCGEWRNRETIGTAEHRTPLLRSWLAN
jgi:hypothetical protein